MTTISDFHENKTVSNADVYDDSPTAIKLKCPRCLKLEIHIEELEKAEEIAYIRGYQDGVAAQRRGVIRYYPPAALAAEEKQYPADAGCTKHIGEPWPCLRCAALSPKEEK